ncbi:septal ring lytic transglycosylase RlpA family protein [Hyphomicrobium sulfonivorans]|uniref:septal ring lytic transglycosylase RlpA family protein n=1 Tax=Hyphomicrobium sulfonivorans TaxID=121290 RepID=UPI0009FB2AAD|nr:septal ring lytic transglycosylase RlpA family protein [Hyphomicrobium sulfonivorans]
MAWSTSTWAKRIRLVCIASIAPAITAMAIPATVISSAEAKTPGKTYCFVGKCHRVKTIAETEALVGKEQSVVASHYDDCKKDRYNPCGLTSSGERFHPDRPDNTASPVYPDGTTLLVWNPNNKRALVVRVNNAGPYWGNRTLDLSRAAAEKLGFAGQGVAKLKMKVVKAPEAHEARYKKNRNYDPVPGDIGQYASITDAHRGMAVVMAFKATTGSPFAPVTTANAFAGQTVGSARLLVAEAPQAIGRVTTVAYTAPNTPLAFGGFRTQSRAVRSAASSLGSEHSLGKANRAEWDEDGVVDGPVRLSQDLVTASIATPSIAEKSQAVKSVATTDKAEAKSKSAAKSAKKSDKARIAAAVYADTPKPEASKSSSSKKHDDSSKAEKSDAKVEKKSTSKSRKSAKSKRGSGSKSKVANYESRGGSYYGSSYGNSYSDRSYTSSRSAGQLMSDNLRRL